MDWNNRFAARTLDMKRSAVRELLKVTSQPGMISFAGGLPAAELFPIDRIREATNAVLTQRGRRALQYGQTEGLAELREWIACHMSTAQLQISHENIAIVSGAQQGLDLLGRVLLERRDRVVVENPTYLALLSAWRPLGVDFLPVSSDAEGMCVDELKALLKARPKLIYTMPNFANPQGTTLSVERRSRLLTLLRRHDFAAVEDDPYGQLHYSGRPGPHLLTLDSAGQDFQQGRVIYVGTFSKILTPGLRVGWLVAPKQVIGKVVQAKQAADLQTSTFNQHLVLQLVHDGFLDQHLPLLRRQYGTRRDAMLASLARHMPPQANWTNPGGGMFLMLRLPAGLTGAALLRCALQQQVAFVPGEEFHLRGKGQDTIRLNFTNSDLPRIEEGIKRLGRIIREMCSRSDRAQKPVGSEARLWAKSPAG